MESVGYEIKLNDRLIPVLVIRETSAKRLERSIYTKK